MEGSQAARVHLNCSDLSELENDGLVRERLGICNSNLLMYVEGDDRRQSGRSKLFEYG